MYLVVKIFLFDYKQNISLSPHLGAIVLSPLTLLGGPELIENRIVDNTEDNILQFQQLYSLGSSLVPALSTMKARMVQM